MVGIGQVLVRIRLQKGYLTAKDFYNYLKSRNLECNYQYYVKIEKNIILPSYSIINQIAKSLKKNEAEELIKIACATMFQNYEYLFNVEEINVTPENDLPEFPQQTLERQGQKELSISQVNVIAKRKNNYYLFLLMTLARRPLKNEEISLLKGIKNSLEDLLEAKILIKNKNNEILAASNEFRFPASSINSSLSKIYDQLDLWDKEFGVNFDFDKLINKMMIRRISPRYLNLIQKHIDMLTDLLRASDESDIQYNDQVLQLSIQLSHGKVIG